MPTSSNEVAVSVRELSKSYTIVHNAEKSPSLREAVLRRFHQPFKTAARETFWALHDMSFEIKRGDVLGIIGRNGAGKSTLLKILSRITQPTTGRIDMFGRVGSLLEVGTGFHPELTGRENVYLNGAILGMTRREIDRQFDAIVDFAGVEKFLDTPVKRYSSGMYVRLAFAVAAHLNPEILIVDEVLAVGDAEFQKKCLGKLGEVAKQGRTVMFVSHNLGTVSHLCSTGLVLNAGRIDYYGTAEEAVHYYNGKLLHLENKPNGQPPHVLFHTPENAAKHEFSVTRIEMLDTEGNPKPCLATWDDVVFRIWYSSQTEVRRGAVILQLTGHDGSSLLILSTQPDGVLPLSFEAGEGCVECVIKNIPFSAGDYILGAGLAIPWAEWLWQEKELCGLTIVAQDVYGSGLAPTASRSYVAVNHSWRVAS